MCMFQDVTKGNVLEVFGQLRLVVAVASEGEETDDNAKVIASALTSAAALLSQSQLTPEEMVEVSGYIFH